MGLRVGEATMSAPTYMSGSFTLGDWLFERFEPNNNSEPREVWIVATKGDEKHTRKVPLYHPNIFGLDVEDAANINDVVEALIKELGAE